MIEKLTVSFSFFFGGIAVLVTQSTSGLPLEEEVAAAAEEDEKEGPGILPKVEETLA